MKELKRKKEETITKKKREMALKSQKTIHPVYCEVWGTFELLKPHYETGKFWTTVPKSKLAVVYFKPKLVVVVLLVPKL